MQRAATIRRALAAVALSALGASLPGSGAAASPPRLPVAGTSAYVRVDELGYPAAGPKRAYVLSSAPESGRWALRSVPQGTTVFEATIGPRVHGSWSRRFPYVYALDFDSVRDSGTYTIVLEGAAAASASPSFAIAPARALYRAPLANALSFYRNERDGAEYVPSALRNAPGHLNDASAMTYLTPKVDSEGAFSGDLTPLGKVVDASGGWWDAGDYLKFVQTTSYTVALQLLGARDFPATMGAGAPSADFAEEGRFGVEWLLRMWDDASRTLYYQVGIGTGNAHTRGDHDIWRLPQQDDSYGGTQPLYRYIRHRPVFRAGPAGSPVSPNLAGRDAAAFALCSQVLRRSEPALADRCLLAAEHIFELADTAPKGPLLTAIPFGFYPETEWRDDLELGATELAVALAEPAERPGGLPHPDAGYYLRKAAMWAKAYITHNAGGGGEGLNLYDVSALAHYELVRAIRAEETTNAATRLAVTRGQLIADLGAELAAARRQASHDPFGFGFPWATSDTASHGDGLAVMASEYDYLTSTGAYASAGQRWLDAVLGANAWGSSFIIGDGSTFPDCPQHQVANIAGSLTGTSPVLAGAVVEGPNSEASSGTLPGMRACPVGGGDAFAPFNGHGAIYRDNVQSFTTTEPAIDLTASSMLAFSWLSAGAPEAGPARG